MTHAPQRSSLEQAGAAGPDSMAARLVVPSADVMLAARLEAPARAAGLAIIPAATAGELEAALAGAQTPLVLLDLGDAAFPFAETLATVLRLAPEARSIGIFPHVRPEMGKAAEDAGCDMVMPRSRFFTDTGAVLRAALSEPRAGLKPAPRGTTRAGG